MVRRNYAMKLQLGKTVQFALRTLTALVINLSYAPSVPAASWITNGPMMIARQSHTATLLTNGKVLVAGGQYFGDFFLSGAELYDPANGTWQSTGAMKHGRAQHTATLLPSGKVLVAGGIGSIDSNPFVFGSLSSAELYDPISETWTEINPMSYSRLSHTATLLLNGDVLVAGSGSANTELFNPGSNTWTTTGSMSIEREFHTATLLPNGNVIVTGGYLNGVYTSRVEIYNPSTGKWMTRNAMAKARLDHTATLMRNGKVLVTGGFNASGCLASAELFDPSNGHWTTISHLNAARGIQSATLLPNGKVLVVGGTGTNNVVLTSTEIYDPVTGLWATNSATTVPRTAHTATLLANGQVLATGGAFSTGLMSTLASTEVYDYANGTWTNTGPLATPRYFHSATLLSSGKVLVTGGEGSNYVTLSSAEEYLPDTGLWITTSAMNTQREAHTATLLADGKVIVAGGYCIDDGTLSSAELFSAATSTWTNTGTMNIGRWNHTATLLRNGKILVAGGLTDYGAFILGGSTPSSELYDPIARTWTPTGSMCAPRCSHTAVLLPDGKVLVAGGRTNFIYNTFVSSAELYDPLSGTWTMTGALNFARDGHTATLLPNGCVLVAGGYGSAFELSSAEMYDPKSGTWTTTGSMATARLNPTATLLPNGNLLVAGGYNSIIGAISSAELYNPTTKQWIATRVMNSARYLHTTTLLLSGKVMVSGGVSENSLNYLPGVEMYDSGVSFSNSWRPRITSLTSPLNLGGTLAITGSQFRGISEGSGGNSQNSSTDYPLVQLRSIESGQTTFLLATNWSTNSFASVPVWNFPPGFALATVFVNGIQSTSSIVNISVPIPLPTTLTSPTKSTNGSFQFAFTNNTGALLGVLATTNLSLPQTNWTALGGIAEISPGQFQFTDPQATNMGCRFYRLRTP